MICFSSLSVLINDSSTIDFQIRREFCQGDRIYRFLFILVVEGVAGLMGNVCASHCFQHFILSDQLQFNFLQFIDDTVIIEQPSWKNIWSIKALLRGLELSSGFSINFHKSKILVLTLNWNS